MEINGKKLFEKCEICKRTNHKCLLIDRIYNAKTQVNLTGAGIKKKFRAINKVLKLRKKQKRITNPGVFNARIETARAVAWGLYLKTSKIENRINGTTEPILKNATVDQTKKFRNIDQIFKNVYKNMKQNE